MARGRGTGRMAAAVALSIALHLSLAAAPLTFRRAPVPPTTAPAFPVELRRRAPAVAPAAAAPTLRSGGARAAPGGTPPPPGEAATGGAGAGEALARWLLGGRVPRPDGGDLLSVAPPAGRVPAAENAPVQERLRRTVGDVMDGLRAQDLARYPDASWVGLRDALGDGFVPPAESLDLARGGGAGGGGPGLLGRFLDGYGAAAQRYGRTGSTLPSGPGAPGARDGSLAAHTRAVAAGGASGDRVGLAAAVDALDAQTGPAAPTEASGGLVTVVAIRLDESGAVAEVRLVSRSASVAYDRAALARAERLAGRELSPRLAGTTTEWAFATEVRIRPVSASAALQFDATFKPTGFAHPLERITRTRVELRAVRRGTP